MEPFYISANIAVARTRNARKSDFYQAEHILFPKLMGSAMERISDAAAEGKGECTWHVYSYLHEEHSEEVCRMAISLAEEKIEALGYRLVHKDENLYNIIWLSEGEE